MSLTVKQSQQQTKKLFFLIINLKSVIILSFGCRIGYLIHKK